MKNDMLQKTEQYVKRMLGNDATGHDWFHIERVRSNAFYIWDQEQKGDRFIIEMAALLHDIPDDKLNDSAEAGASKLSSFLHSLPLIDKERHHITEIIFSISFKGGQVNELTSVEAEIVQDADRLDAIGAIGIARAFAYGGKKGQPIYNPEFPVRHDLSLQENRNGNSTTINHFYEKLLKLKTSLNTGTAIQMAEKRHLFMETFLSEFYNEWNGRNENDFN